MVQRILGARSIPHAQWGALLAGFLKLLTLFIIVIPGIFSLKLFPHLPNPDMVYPTMLINLIPDGVKGIVLAGLIAAIMSSVDSALNGTSALIVLDFIQPKRPHLTENQLMQFGRVTTLLVMFVAGLWAPLIQNFEGLFNYLQQVLSFAVPPVVCIFLFGFFWKKGTALAAKYTLIFGHLFCFTCLYFVNAGLFRIHFTIIAAILTGICMMSFIVMSLIAPGSGKNLENLTWSRGMSLVLPGSPWYLQARNIGIFLVALTLIIVGLYW